ncbi:MAG: ATPase, T2SS/T4P/T4SS family [Candidatus Omnitrophota bacterium]
MEAKVISFFSTKGGVGKTLVSLNVAVQLAIQNKRVFLLDLDLGAPQATSKLIGVDSKYCLFNLIDYLKEFKEKKRKVDNYAVTYQNIMFLPSIFKMSQRTAFTPQVVKDFISVIWDDFDYIIIDAGSNLTDNLIAALECSNLISLILTPDILAVYQTQWLMDTLQSLGFPLTMIKVVLNRAESKGSITWQEVKALLPAETIALIPSEGRAAGLAVNRGVPLVLDSPQCRFTLAIQKLSKDIVERKDMYISHKSLSDVRLAKEKFEGGEEAFWQRVGVIEREEKVALIEEEDEIIRFKKQVHERLIEELDLKRLHIETYATSPQKMNELRAKAEKVISNVISKEAGGFISATEVRRQITKDILEEALGLGPLEDLLRDPTITEVMVNNKDQIYIERFGKLEVTSKKFTTNEQVRIVVERILAPLGRRIDESVPYVDARLPDGSRVNAIIPPLSLTGPTLTIRKFAKQRWGMEDLINRFGSLTHDMALFLEAAVRSRKNSLVSGGTGSGKTTFLNILSAYIPDSERIISIEDAAELKLRQAHWIRLESRPPNIEGRGEITIRDLFRNTLRMRPDRIIVGEVRGREVLDMLQAMNTGHDGSMSTIHANSTHDVLIRLDSMILMSGVELPLRAIREQVSSAINLVVHTARLSDGSRKVIAITEIIGMLDETHINMQDIFVYRQTGVDKDGNVQGYYTPLGYIPTFYDEIRARGIDLSREIFVPKD